MAVKDFYKSPLTIYVVWHPDNELGLKYAEAIYNTFCRDTYSPLTRGLGIPVRFRFKAANGEQYPIDIDVMTSDRNAILLLADSKMFLDSNWFGFIQNLLDKEDGNNRLFPVALSAYAFSIDENRLNKKQFINLTTIEDADKQKELLKRTEELKGRLLHDLSRMFLHLNKVSAVDEEPVKPPVKLFISHAKVDGEKLAGEFRNYILSAKKLKSFFDANDIEDAGAKVICQLKPARNALLYIQGAKEDFYLMA